MRPPMIRVGLRAAIGSTRAMSSISSTTANSSSVFPTPEALPIKPPSLADETQDFEERCARLSAFFSLPRFSLIKRPYTPAAVASKQGSMPVLPLPSTYMADKLYATLSKAAEEGRPVHTMGAIDSAQMSQMAANQDVVYISGWACSSLLTTGNNEVGPDFGDYPYTTVPNQVHRIFRAQQLHDKKHYDERMTSTPEARSKMPYVDYLRPIIADADTGHGGLSAVMKLVKLFAESGAAAIHMEDQLHGGKKCGHLGGKVVVPASAHVSRLIASRFQLDMMQNTMLLIARTDAESAKLISSTVDVADHEFIIGTTTPGNALADEVSQAEADGASAAELEALETKWLKEHDMCTFNEAVEKSIKASDIGNKDAAYQEYLAAVENKSNTQAREIAKDMLGKEVFWNWDLPRTREGYYHFTGGVEAAIKRSKIYAPYADLLWVETSTPNLSTAKYISSKIREQHPGKWFTYNLSPSFNWASFGFNDADLKNFVWDLGKEGFVLQLISLAGLHCNAVSWAELSRRFKEDGMLAYIQLVQQKERELGVDILTHQKWSGANYVDRILQSVSSSSSTSSVGAGSTEHAF
ncbi:isocitrate lyase and phosphorylmutase [Schizopora paradoxa]|uniref:Isocitrate lyase n=1 Tax=Schizopora paradoxa TaxID=27342 RepID=A0A0H2SDK8_9AGAM|nr:isocitrate lyase and phosphorylmutase [Schizopora paradoxa]